MRGKEIKNVRLSLKINQQTDEYIQTIANNRGITKSAAVCWLLNKCQILRLE